jgi:hypothetical protein
VAGVVSAASSYDYYNGYPNYGPAGYPYAGVASEPSCSLLIRRIVEPSGRVVIRRQHLCP